MNSVSPASAIPDAPVPKGVDCDVIDTASLDQPFAAPYIVAFADGRIVECADEDSACSLQREHRVAAGLHPISGDVVG